MRLARARRALAGRPRVILALLLAFAVEILPASSGVVSHHHAGGAVGHHHGGRVVGGTPVRVADVSPVGGSELQSAPARDLHAHRVQPVVGLRAPHVAATGPTLLVSDVSSSPALAETAAIRGAAQARGPLSARSRRLSFPLGSPVGRGGVAVTTHGHSRRPGATPLAETEEAEANALASATDEGARRLQLPETVVQGDRPITAASSLVVRSRDVSLRPIRRPADILEVTPGFVVVQHAGGGKANQYYLRGFDADHGTDVAISVDGVPVNNVSHAHGQGYADVNWVIPEIVERIEVDKGPYFVKHGDFATAGAVNMVTKRAVAENTATLSGGRFDLFRGVLELPLAAHAEAERSTATPTVTIAADGGVRFEGAPLPSTDLVARLRRIYADRSEKTVMLAADRSLGYARVVEVMDACRAAGIERIGIVTAPPPPS